MRDRSSMVKIRLWGPDAGESETVWASQVAADLYRVENSPFLAYGVSWEDIIEAHQSSDSVLEYVRCVRKSGNQTLRIVFQDFRSDEEPAQEILGRLGEWACTYEGMQPRLVSLNVPPKTDLQRVADFLTLRSGIQWEYADPTYEQVKAGMAS